MTKTMSPEAIEANRRNAQHATGPKTPEGKAASSANSVKHGILARQVVVNGYKIHESIAEFKEFCGAYYDHLAPAGPLEEMLVDQIIAIHWRLRRARMAESAEIALSVHCAWRINGPKHPRSVWTEWLAYQDPIHSMKRTAIGNGLIQNQLRELRNAVERDGELTEAAIKEMVSAFCGRPNVLTIKLDDLRVKTSQIPEGQDPAVRREANKKLILDYLDRELRQLPDRIEDCQNDENAFKEASQQAAILPSADTVDKILRYETALERQLFRAMNELERLQRRRLGEKIPPPVTAEVSVS